PLLLHPHLTSRNLPSFPTRRSSDLACEDILHRQLGVDPMPETQALRAEMFEPSTAMVLAGGHPANDYQTASLPACDTDQKLTTADRKSTRLNSSHSQISYAVFCLKK